METTIVYWGHIGIMENEMETTIGSHLESAASASLIPFPTSWGRESPPIVVGFGNLETYETFLLLLHMV